METWKSPVYRRIGGDRKNIRENLNSSGHNLASCNLAPF